MQRERGFGTLATFQQTFTCSKQLWKHLKKIQNMFKVNIYFLLTLNIFHTSFPNVSIVDLKE